MAGIMANKKKQPAAGKPAESAAPAGESWTRWVITQIIVGLVAAVLIFYRRSLHEEAAAEAAKDTAGG